MDSEQVKENIKNVNQWLRIAYMVLFAIILYAAMAVMWIVVLVQAIFALLTGSVNDNIHSFSTTLTQYINQIILFLTYNAEDKPFPFQAWGEAGVAVAKTEAKKPAAKKTTTAKKPAAKKADTATDK